MRMNKLIGEIFLERNLVSPDQILAISNTKSSRLFGEKALDLGLISEEKLIDILSEIYHVEIINLEFLYIKKETLNLLSLQTTINCRSIAFFEDEKLVKVAIADPGNIIIIDKIRSEIKDREVKFFIT